MRDAGKAADLAQLVERKCMESRATFPSPPSLVFQATTAQWRQPAALHHKALGYCTCLRAVVSRWGTVWPRLHMNHHSSTVFLAKSFVACLDHRPSFVL